MVTWAKENAVSSGLGDALIRWIVDDCVKFVEREIRRGNHYDAIIMDPPSYGRGPKGEIWKIEDAIYPLVQLCEQLLSDDPLFFLINSYTTGLQPAVLSYMMNTVLKNTVVISPQMKSVCRFPATVWCFRAGQAADLSAKGGNDFVLFLHNFCK